VRWLNGCSRGLGRRSWMRRRGSHHRRIAVAQPWQRAVASCPFPAIPAGSARRRGGWNADLRPIVWRAVRSRQKGSSKEPRAGGSNPLLRREHGACLLFSLPLGAIRPHFTPALTAAICLRRQEPAMRLRVGLATGRAYRSWRRRPPSSCPPRLASPSSRRLFSPL
jgi:hypothetical protein